LHNYNKLGKTNKFDNAFFLLNSDSPPTGGLLEFNPEGNPDKKLSGTKKPGQYYFPGLLYHL